MDDRSGLGKLGAYLGRAARWRCPVCGRTPIFPRVASIRHVRDWFLPLDGCPRCGYAFEREPGYFRLAVWGLNSAAATLLGFFVYAGVVAWVPVGWPGALAIFVGAVVFFNLALIRHAKAFYLAIDHLLDPHERGGGDDGGNRRVEPLPKGISPGGRRPDPCVTGPRVP